MKAAICPRYGPPEVVQVREVPKPAPKDNGVLVRIRATAVDISDARIRALRVPRGLALPVRFVLGFRGPRRPILGYHCAGEIEAVGRDVTRFRPGDAVVASAGDRFGCHAEYGVFPADGAVARKPDSLSHGEAVSLLFGGITALVFFRAGALKRGERLLVNGASGAVGTIAVQLARHLGAEVTGVCSTANVERVRSLGADRVIDYTREDFTRGEPRYDVIMDNVGNAPFRRIRHLLAPGGRYLMVIGDLPQMIAGHFNKQVVNSDPTPAREVFTAENYAHLMELAAQGHLKPVIDSTFPLERIAEAHARVDTGHKVGSVVVEVGE